MLPPCYHAFLLPSWTCILWNINSLYPKFLLIMVFYHSDKLLNFYSEIKLLAAFTTRLRLTVFLCQFCWTKLFSHLFKRHATKKNPMTIWSLLYTRSSYCIALGEEPFSLAVFMCKSWIGFFSLDIFSLFFPNDYIRDPLGLCGKRDKAKKKGNLELSNAKGKRVISW